MSISTQSRLEWLKYKLKGKMTRTCLVLSPTENRILPVKTRTIDAGAHTGFRDWLQMSTDNQTWMLISRSSSLISFHRGKGSERRKQSYVVLPDFSKRWSHQISVRDVTDFCNEYVTIVRLNGPGDDVSYRILIGDGPPSARMIKTSKVGKR